MAAEAVCDACGEPNAPDAQFCSSCSAFLAWDGRPDADRTVLIDPRVIALVAQRPPGGFGPGLGAGSGPLSSPPGPLPSSPIALTPPAMSQSGAGQPGYRIVQPPGRAAQPVPPAPVEPADLVAQLGVTLAGTTVELLPTGEPVTVEVLIANRSDIVDGYLADVPSRPPWLNVVPADVRLLPGTDETVTVTLSLSAGTMVPAQQIRVPLRVASTSHPEIESVTSLTVTVRAVDGVLLLRLEPQVVKVRDAAEGVTAVSIENRGSNRTTRVTLAGADPELAVGFAFEPPTLDIPPGVTVTAKVRLRAAPPAAGQEATRAFTVTARDGTRTADAPGTFVQTSTAVVVDPPVEVRLEPSVIRVRDITVASMTLGVDNTRGTRPARLTLAGRDPERLIRFSFYPPVLTVPPGGRASARVDVEAPLPPPGTEATRTFAISLADGQPVNRPVEATGTLVQSTSAVLVDPPVGLRVDPEVVMIAGSGSGHTTVTVDNRAGRRPTRVYLTGHDPEGLLRLTFQPPVVDVPPGAWVRADLVLASPRPGGGREVERRFAVVATDQDSSVEAGGLVRHRAADLLPTIRILLVLLGVAMMVGGVFLPWLVGYDLTGIQWTLDQFNRLTTSNLRPLDPRVPDLLVSGGIIILATAVLALFGLTGTKGRLIRLATVLGAAGIVAFVIAFKIFRRPEVTGSGRPAVGAILIALGCLLAFVGSLVRRRAP